MLLIPSDDGPIDRLQVEEVNWKIEQHGTCFTAMSISLQPLNPPRYEKVAVGSATGIQTSDEDIMTNALSKDARFIIGYLAAVYDDQPQIPGCLWNTNDYSYIGQLAAKLNAGSLTLNSLKWQGPGHGTTKAQRYVAQAVVAQIMAERDDASKNHDQNTDGVQGELDGYHMSMSGLFTNSMGQLINATASKLCVHDEIFE